jgi:hypothetical protein
MNLVRIDHMIALSVVVNFVFFASFVVLHLLCRAKWPACRLGIAVFPEFGSEWVFQQSFFFRQA